MTTPVKTFEHIAVDVQDEVAIVTLERANVLNALNAALLRELSQALSELDNREDTGAVIITGSGNKAFAAGADIGELNALQSAVDGANKARIGQALTLQIERMRKPVIMAINGFALGGGCELAMAGDIRIAAQTARFGQPEVNLGLIPGYGGSQRTTRLLGKGMAMYLCLTGEIIDANEALRIGLVQKVVPAEELLEEAKRIAWVIASKSPLAITACKRAVNNGAHLPIADALELEALEFGALVNTEDFKEGTSAFLEKRKPAWKRK
ncbi:MAG TPA: enoyl-CoA hydratase-related protein [Candidatus Baltobacteraceae bacterium]|jgi:enoyl-CoA hydratase|nr:enoyl-CoA hydratase-related protein [Candidatus Baltobacteraceae bacterium]